MTSGFDEVDQARAEAGDGWADRGAVPGGIETASTLQNGPGAVVRTGNGIAGADRARDGLAGDGKDAGAFRTIGEVTKALNIAPHVLRYWEEQFPMLRPVKRSGGRRLYRPEDIALLEEIHRLVHSQGFTLRGARQFLENRSGTSAGQPPSVEDRRDSSALLDGLVALRQDLARLLEH
ncbi:MAG: MerR family transcriptional regulator [Sphingomonadales bacterium]|nr:MerR family transcriptional regulator [Sphingomonadales bacterium]MDE2168562.1 MerR family transcriptional regulator [Sphingomonadales bacterium]